LSIALFNFLYFDFGFFVIFKKLRKISHLFLQNRGGEDKDHEALPHGARKTLRLCLKLHQKTFLKKSFLDFQKTLKKGL